MSQWTTQSKQRFLSWAGLVSSWSNWQSSMVDALFCFYPNSFAYSFKGWWISHVGMNRLLKTMSKRAMSGGEASADHDHDGVNQSLSRSLWSTQGHATALQLSSKEKIGARGVLKFAWTIWTTFIWLNASMPDFATRWDKIEKIGWNSFFSLFFLPPWSPIFTVLTEVVRPVVDWCQSISWGRTTWSRSVTTCVWACVRYCKNPTIFGLNEITPCAKFYALNNL